MRDSARRWAIGERDTSEGPGFSRLVEEAPATPFRSTGSSIKRILSNERLIVPSISPLYPFFSSLLHDPLMPELIPSITLNTTCAYPNMRRESPSYYSDCLKRHFIFHRPTGEHRVAKRRKVRSRPLTMRSSPHGAT